MASQSLARMLSEERYKNDNLPEILHKTPNFLCINKGFDIKINSDDPVEFTVESQLRKMFPELVDPGVAHGFRYVHRLDFATSGILCLALNKNAAKQMSRQFSKKQVLKYYLALVRGHLDDDMVFIDVPTGDLEDTEWPGRRCVSSSPVCKDPKISQTLLIALEKGLFDGSPATKVVLQPVTGRQHQLRVHCDYIGNTIVGDYTYSLRQDTVPDRMMLHSYRLVTSMQIEDVDLITQDPFTPGRIKEWLPQQVIRTYEEAERLGITFDPRSSDAKKVELKMWT